MTAAMLTSIAHHTHALLARVLLAANLTPSGMLRCSCATTTMIFCMRTVVDAGRLMAKMMVRFDFATLQDDTHIDRKGAATRNQLCAARTHGENVRGRRGCDEARGEERACAWISL